MASFTETTDIEAALTRLVERPDGPYVVRLAREPNRRDSRWAHLFSGPVADPYAGGAGGLGGAGVSGGAGGAAESADLGGHPGAVSPPEVSFPASRTAERLAKLEDEVAALRAELEDLKSRLGG
jgi:uncharacterized protein YceH (UPF0502 family)